jgi:transcription antitermination factor NusG
MKITVIISKTSFKTAEGATMHGVVLASGQKVWNTKPGFKVGDTVGVTSEKFQDKEGKWKTRHSIAKIKIG